METYSHKTLVHLHDYKSKRHEIESYNSKAFVSICTFRIFILMVLRVLKIQPVNSELIQPNL